MGDPDFRWRARRARAAQELEGRYDEPGRLGAHPGATPPAGTAPNESRHDYLVLPIA